MKTSMICAMASNRGIGYKNTLPWRLSNDLQHFKALTMGKAIVMGRKTYESIGRPLPGRRNLILSRDPNLEIPGTECFTSYDEIRENCAQEEEVFIIGGAQIYEILFDEVDTLHLTLIDAEIVADAFFPEFDHSQWKETSRERHKADSKNDYDYSFVTLEKV
ncbi:Dihydrofolate reductase [Lentisphaera araneosa HTCC2155]|uniref:Dihydrofolate reductase n=1 Tax=Lentisphaera araneosa HTCC2155 TaxID=313628 RepID=A6DH01_9BACT|nr:dihydrofolate reductase [Lentisphaera araneosa]EDM28884.1 Dihydrofolate reductase [Lentisphaera araneosa HTCC2155]